MKTKNKNKKEWISPEVHVLDIKANTKGMGGDGMGMGMGMGGWS
jgi:hypothetical protein